jgi:GntR family transcriptional regulator/MocR family aminotransferase
LDLVLDLSDEGPMYARLFQALRLAILDGQLPARSRLPATRSLARDYSVARNVVVMAYEQLVAEGYASSLVGSGTYVSDVLPEGVSVVAERSGAPVPGGVSAGTGHGATAHELATGDRSGARAPAHGNGAVQEPATNGMISVAPPKLSTFGRSAESEFQVVRGELSQTRRVPQFDFRYGRVEPEARGLHIFRSMLGRRRLRLYHDYGDPMGYLPLRRVIADYLATNRGVRCEPEQVMVVNGSQQALDIVARVLLEPGDGVAIEDPQYRGARPIFTAQGLRLMPVSVDAEGLRVEDLATMSVAGGERRAGLVYVTPSHQFPTGAVMSVTRRLALLEWAAKTDAYVLEDDYDSEFRYEGRPVQAVQGLDASGRTIYVGTFSKVLFPALRVGYVVVPGQLVDAFAGAKWLSDRQSPMVEQVVLADFLEQGYFEQHLRRMRTSNARRRNTLLGALDAIFGRQVSIWGPNAGLHLLAWFPELSTEDVSAWCRRALDVDVGIYSVAPLYLRQPSEAGIIMGYASLSEEAIIEGVGRLRAAFPR